MSHKPTYMPSVVILRGIAAFLVVAQHLFGREPYAVFNRYFGWFRTYNLGYYGVVCFFVISGFALSHSLGESYTLGDFGRFLARRLVRIEPTFFASILFSSLVVIVLTRIAPNGTPWLPSAKQLLCHALYLVPFTKQEWITPAYWTLASEFQFYLTIGLLYPWLLRVGRRFSFGIPLGLILFALMSLLWPLCPPLELLKYSPFFALGILLERQLSRPLPRFQLYGTVLVIAGIAASSKILHPLLGSGAGVVTFLLIYHWRPEFKKENRVARVGMFLGTISYSWYVVHQVIAAAGESAARFMLHLRPFAGQWVAVNLVPVASFSSTLMAAWLLYRWVESPTHRLARKIKPKGEAGSEKR